MERIGIYGGTYNPPHIGHLRAAEYAVEALKLDRLLLIPTGVSPHKEMASGAGSADRLGMLRLSAKGIEKAEVSDIELKREGRSYTVDTLRQLKAENPGAELVLLESNHDPELLRQNPHYPMVLKNRILGKLCVLG